MSTESTEVPREQARGAPSNYSAGEARRREIRQRQPHRRAPVKTYVNEARTAQALGWLSVGLGLTALFAPRAVGTLTGIGSRTGLLRAIGLRELAAGVGLLTARDATPWLWSRVLGDTMDLMVLGAAAARPDARNRLSELASERLGSGESPRTRSLVSLGVVAGITAADIAASIRQTRQRSSGAHVGAADEYLERSVIIAKSPQECYDYWRNLNNAPNFMRTIDSVTVLDERRSHWVGKIGGKTVEWESRISEDKPGERIAWHSDAGAPLTHAGVVSFERAPGDRGTVVRWVVHYQPPGGRAGLSVARLLGKAPASEVQEDLRRFKQILETGEIATTRGQPAGRRSAMARMVGAGRGA